jgi:hypothetical protein
MFHQPSRQAPFGAAQIAAVAVALLMLVVLVFSFAELGRGGVSGPEQPLRAPAGLGL